MKDLEEEVRKILRKNMWMVLATADENNQPHCSVVVYQSDGNVIYFQTGPTALKTKHIQQNNKISITIPFRKNFGHKLIPAPPAELHFKATAEIVPKDNEEAKSILARFIRIAEKAELKQETIWVKITPISPIATFGVGIKLRHMRKPEKARNIVHLNQFRKLVGTKSQRGKG